MALSITSVLNNWAEMGVFSYVLPFLIIFSIVFAILQKTKLFGTTKDREGKTTGSSETKGVNVVISLSVALLSLLNDYVPTFFASIMPRFGIALVVLLVLLVIFGFATGQAEVEGGKWIGWVLFIVVLVWAFNNWNMMFGLGGGFDLTYYVEEYLAGILLIGGIIGVVYAVTK